MIGVVWWELRVGRGFTGVGLNLLSAVVLREVMVMAYKSTRGKDAVLDLIQNRLIFTQLYFSFNL